MKCLAWSVDVGFTFICKPECLSSISTQSGTDKSRTLLAPAASPYCTSAMLADRDPSNRRSVCCRILVAVPKAIKCILHALDGSGQERLAGYHLLKKAVLHACTVSQGIKPFSLFYFPWHPFYIKKRSFSTSHNQWTILKILIHDSRPKPSRRKDKEISSAFLRDANWCRCLPHCAAYLTATVNTKHTTTRCHKPLNWKSDSLQKCMATFLHRFFVSRCGTKAKSWYLL